MKALLCQLNFIIGDLQYNTEKILSSLEKARSMGAEIVVFSEMALCGYPPDDLLFYDEFISSLEKELKKIIKASKDLCVIVGTIRKNSQRGKPFFNSAAIICDQKLVAYKDKTLLPTYDVFYEDRYFQAGKKQLVFEYKNQKIGLFICEDVWEHGKKDSLAQYAQDPVQEMIPLKPDLAILISGSPYYYQKMDFRYEVYSSAAKDLQCPMLCVNQVGANDQLIFDGYSCFLDDKGNLSEIAKGFEEDYLLIDLEKKYPIKKLALNHKADLYKALVLGVKDYFKKQHFTKACLGLSGGIDSSLTACIAVDALGKENVLGVSMPSRFSSLGSIEDTIKLKENLGIELKEIPIDHLFQEYLNLLAPFFMGKKTDTTEENIQARIRGMILMALSNKLGYIVLSTGNKSEMATGYTTLYGDMAGGLGLLNDVSKTLVYELAHLVNSKKEIIPKNCLIKAPSAELSHNHIDQDDLPPYAILDQILEYYVEKHASIDQIAKQLKVEKELVKSVIERIHHAEYKRRQGPPCLIVTKKAFGKGRIFPIVQGWVK
jgi:NAD+ synthase (glutamine-hydrolysing)